MQEFILGTQLFRGANALEWLKTLNFKRALLVTDAFFVQNGTAEKIRQLCQNTQLHCFDQVQPDPPLSLIAQGVAVVQSFAPEAIIALGGGSAIDCAKGILSMSDSDAVLIAIPTTSGTGSEVTSFAVLTHDGVKHPLVESRLRPKYAILDDTLLAKLPKTLIAETGMDAVAHCIEAVAAKKASPFSDAMASYALQLLLKNLSISYNGDSSVRGTLHCAATMAGIAFDNAGLGLCHALSHAIGGAFHLPHGKINAILLPAVMRFNNSPAYQRLSNFCGLAGTHGLIFAIERLRKALSLPERLSQAGLKRADVLKETDTLCQAALNDPCICTNPKIPTKEDLAKILLEVL